MYKYRAEITKGEEIRYISHLDYAGAIERAIRRAKLPAAYSEGFNPHIKLAFASALSLGVVSEAEYMDFELTKPLCQPEVFEKLSGALPVGIRLLRLRAVREPKPCRGKKHKALMAEVEEAEYEILLPLTKSLVEQNENKNENNDKEKDKEYSEEHGMEQYGMKQHGMEQHDMKQHGMENCMKYDVENCMKHGMAAAAAAVEAYNRAGEAVIHRVTPKTDRLIETKQYMLRPVRLSRQGDLLRLAMDIAITPTGSVKPGEILELLVQKYGLPGDTGRALIRRTAMKGQGKPLIDLV